MNSLRFARRLGARLILVAVFLLPLLAGFTSSVAADDDHLVRHAVYTMTNAASGNEIVVSQLSEDGSAYQSTFSTGGLGSGAGLGSQGSLTFGDDNLLFAVNAGSNDISVFKALSRRLVLLDVAASGGEHPISVTANDGFVYVLNGGGSGNITGFKFRKGHLIPLDGSTQPLSNGGTSAAPGPAEISFSPDGNWLAVTEKATNMIDVYAVEDGIAGPPTSYPASGVTPFGFAFDPRGHMIVSEAFGGAPNASALSSYRLRGGFEVISASIGTTQTSACWVVISKDGKYAYDTNAASASISSFRIAKDGPLTLMNPQAGLTGAGSSPIDMAVSRNGQFLFALGGASHMISAFQVNADGSLSSLGQIAVPAGSVGLAAR
jgi:6-phosphogluconolactonase